MGTFIAALGLLGVFISILMFVITVGLIVAIFSIQASCKATTQLLQKQNEILVTQYNVLVKRFVDPAK